MITEFKGSIGVSPNPSAPVTRADSQSAQIQHFKDDTATLPVGCSRTFCLLSRVSISRLFLIGDVSEILY